ncbi:MAG: hypothetical protein JWN98_1055 [Abditibacteriota bacterium]|nr:hypothetical protein [Abditibacteriota bacterium]
MFRLCQKLPIFVRRVAVATAVVGFASSINIGFQPLQAHPGTSPSARAAARLKYRPPAGWIRHYLGDDRYKIKGGTWKVVSTELDQYYYPAWAPEMLRQPAGIVIGFSSARAAEEAGYRRSNYPMDLPTLGLDEGGSGTVTRRAVTTVNRTRRPLLITLADGASTVMLPPNWRRTQSGAQTLAGRTALADTLQPLTGRGAYIRFAFVNAPNPNINLGALLQPTVFRTAFANFARSGQVDGATAGALANLQVGSGRLGGLSGVALRAKPGTSVPGVGGRVIVAGRGGKAYFVDENARGVAGVQALLSSFRPR